MGEDVSDDPVNPTAQRPAAALQPGPVGSRSGLRWALGALCVTQITSWGVLFYAFPVLAPAISADTGWPVTTITAAFSLGQIVAAITGIPVGHWVDRHGPRTLMTAGSVLGAATTLGIATAPSQAAFVAAWGVAGTAMAATFYPPAFAALTRWYGPDRVRALTTLTLAAGLSSTMFAPLTAALNATLTWRQTYVVLAGVLAAVTIPLHALALRPPWPPAATASTPHATGTHPHDGLTAVVRSRAFLTLLAAVTLGGFSVYAVVVHQVPLLTQRGLQPQLAAWALGLGGIGQVLGRLLYGPLAARSSIMGRTTTILTACAVATGALGGLPGPAAMLVAAAMLAGMARGMFTLLQATAVSDRWGASVYGRLTGLLSAPITAATAIAPWSGAALAASLGGYPELFAVLTACGLAAAGLALWSTPAADHRQP